LKYADHILTKENLLKLKKQGDKYKGKSYDLLFEWSDEKIYCSELVWKIYKEALGIELGSLQKIKEFDLSDKSVQAKIKERYGNKILTEELVISPQRIFDAAELELVMRK